MERSRKILQKITSASRRIVTAANEYADRKDLAKVEPAHFQLEDEMQKVSVACQCLVNIIPSTPLARGPAFDDRLKDWVMSDEPGMCCDALDQMEMLLQEDRSSRASSGILVRDTSAMKDKLEEVVHLFNSHKRHFQFLFATNIWNNGDGTQPEVPHSGDDTTQRECSVLGQNLRAPVQMNVETTELSNAVPRVGLREKRLETEVGREKEHDEQLKEIVKWLDAFNSAPKQDVMLSLKQPGTCKWLFDANEYKAWRDSANSFLWLRGEAGAGKSVLASSVIDSLEVSRSEGEIIVFFYCDFRDQRTTHAAGVMRSILSQLLNHFRGSGDDPGSCFDDLIRAKERAGATLNNAMQLAGFVSRIAGLLVQKPLIIVDALEECKDVRELLGALMIIKGHVRLFVTSRPLHIIMDVLLGLPSVSIDDKVNELSADIELHVTRELDARPRLRDLDMVFKAEIRSVLCEKAGGMFRWVQCSIDTLNRCVTKRDVRKALNNLPEGLNETYERTLHAIDANGREGELARRALIWLVAALRPLYLKELMEGLSINLRTRTLDLDFGPMHNGALLDSCGSLITYDQKTDLIILSHFSVKEYLTGGFTLFKLPLYHIDWERANLHLIRSCMCYISIRLKNTRLFGRSSSTTAEVPSDPPEPRNPRAVSTPLRDYVLDNAPDHFSHLGPRMEWILHDIRLLERDIKVHSVVWNNMCQSTSRVMRYTTPSWPTSRHDFTLFILVAFGSNLILRKFLRRSGLKPKADTNPLVYAAYFNKPDHARSLLSRGAKLNQKGWDVAMYCQDLPIEVAFHNCHYNIVTLFVAEGSPVTPRIFALLCHRNDYAKIPSPIMKTLLQTNDFAEAAQGPLTDILLRPSAIFNCLLNNDIDEQDFVAIIRRVVQVNNNLTRGDTLIRVAALRGCIIVIHYLLSLGLSLPSDLLVALDLKRVREPTQMMHCLLKNGADTSTRNGHGDSALHIWLVTSKEVDALEIAKLLVTHGCNPLQVNFNGETPLHIAIRQGYVSVVDYFISRGTSLPSGLLVSRSLNGMRNGLEMIRYLIENGANTRARTSDGKSVLFIALAILGEHDALEIAKLLVAHDCDPLQGTSYGITPGPCFGRTLPCFPWCTRVV